MSEAKRTSPWVWVAVGCLVPLLLLIVIVVGIGTWGFFQVRDLQRTMENPVTRNASAAETLGAERLPDGYHGMIALSVPFGIMSTAMITDREPDADGSLRGFGEHGFVYFDTPGSGNRIQRLREFFDGEGDEPEFFSQNPIRVRRRELIARGVVEETGRQLRWATYRGEVGGADDQEFGPRLSAMVMFDCAAEDRVRMGIWFGPDPAPDTPTAEVDPTGTVADPEEIQRFVAPFRVCDA